MPIFKTNQDIFKTNEEEAVNYNLGNEQLFLPPNPQWDNSRRLQIEDIDIWEVIYQSGGGNGLYAAWCPYAKFFMHIYNNQVEVYYGAEEEKMLEDKLKELKISYPRV